MHEKVLPFLQSASIYLLTDAGCVFLLTTIAFLRFRCDMPPLRSLFSILGSYDYKFCLREPNGSMLRTMTVHSKEKRPLSNQCLYGFARDHFFRSWSSFFFCFLDYLHSLRLWNVVQFARHPFIHLLYVAYLCQAANDRRMTNVHSRVSTYIF